MKTQLFKYRPTLWWCLLVCALCAMPSLLVAQSATNARLAGVYFAYPAPDSVILTPAPEGYHPFYISHYGRHGSRWLPSDSRYEWVNQQFADNANLTKLGKSVKRRLQKVWKNAKGNGGKLTPLGAQQHRGIAQRMVSRFVEVFSDGCRSIEARSSTYDRCQKSMQAFCTALDEARASYASGRQQLATTVARCDSSDMAWIAYSSPDVKALEARTHPRTSVTGQRLAAALFKDPTRVDDADKLLSELHTIAGDMQDVQLNISFDDVLTYDEQHAIYNQNNLRMWICNGRCPDNYGAPALSARSLWQHIVSDADEAVSHGTVAAHLRFGHDTNLYRLLALMGSSSLGMSCPDPMDEILPMAANLQMIFYTNGHDVIVRLLHNEREVVLPVGTPGVFMRWDDMKRLVSRRIAELESLNCLQHVNTMMGTDYAVTPTAGRYGKGSEEHGQTIPAALVPHGMSSWTPQTRDTERKCVAPYYYQDTLMLGFRNSHWLTGGCTQDYGSFTLMPQTGRLRLKGTARGSRFSHADEVSHPDYYAVRLPDEHLTAELTPLSRSALFRFSYDSDGRAYFVIAPNSDEGEGFVAVDTARHCIYGYNPVHRIYQGWGKRAGFDGWFVVRFQQPIADFGVSDTVAWVAFDVKAGQQLMAKAAGSFVDLDGAMRNLDQEIPHWDFSFVRRQAQQAWQERFARVVVTATDDVQQQRKAQLCSALYRTSFLPRLFSDADNRYPLFGGAQREDSDGHSLSANLHAPTAPQDAHYMDFSMWDTYRALHPLNILIEPTSGAMMQSLVRMYEQGGWLPIFPCWNSYTAAMIGDHCTAALADAMVKGVGGIDHEKAYEAMRQNAFLVAPLADYRDGKGRRALDSYLRYGYIPLEDSVPEAFHTHEQVSRTLEYAYDDFALAQVARLLGKTSDSQLLMRRAANWRNAVNPRTGWADGRYADGRWLNNQDQVHRVKFITEGAACHYTWYVPHDPYGLMQVMGGRERYVSRLDSMFTEGLYWHGNEPCHQVAYMFNYAGEPWRTQKWVRHILDTEYLDAPGGLSGNEDAGQMSAWYVFSALGFYPVCPATPYYILGTPSFARAQIGDFVVEAENVSHDNCYIQSATWNGQPYTRNYITHDMLTSGGTLRFVMGPNPNKKWGSLPEDCPPDVMK